MPREGWQGWDEYAPFYDWENARTRGRRDVPFWRRLAADANGPVLELGCGTGRVTRPLARAGIDIVGVDRSDAMLARAARRAKALRHNRRPRSMTLVRGDIRQLPFASASFPIVIAPYGILQSLIRPNDLTATLTSVARVVAPGGIFGVDLVPDVPNWREHRFELTFRTLTVPQMTRQLERAGFVVDSVLGDYRGRPWDARADVWIILPKR